MITYEDVDRQNCRLLLAEIAASPLRSFLVRLRDVLDDMVPLGQVVKEYEAVRIHQFLVALAERGEGYCTRCKAVVTGPTALYYIEGRRQQSKLDCHYSEVTWDEAYREVHELCSDCQRSHQGEYDRFPCELRDQHYWVGQGKTAWVPRYPSVVELSDWTLRTRTAETLTDWRTQGLLPYLVCYARRGEMAIDLYVQDLDNSLSGYAVSRDDIQDVLGGVS